MPFTDASESDSDEEDDNPCARCYSNKRPDLVRYYGHTNRFCVVQKNMKPEVLEVQTELASSVP